MKKTIFLLGLFYCLSYAGYAQTDSTTLDAKLKAIDKKLDVIAKIINSDSADEEEVGTLTLKYDTLRAFISNSSKFIKITIKKVQLNIREGLITDIQVETTTGDIYTNQKAPIELNRLNERSDNLGCKLIAGGHQSYYIRVNDFLEYIRASGTIAGNYHKIILSKKDSVKILGRKLGINSVISLRTYSDLLGLLGEESNAITQVEGDTKFIIHNSNIPNRGTYLLHYLKFNLGVSRFDDKFKSTNLDSTFNRTLLYQKSFLYTEAGLNIFEYTYKKTGNWIGMDAVGGLSLSKGKVDSSITKTFILPHWGLRLNYRVYLSESFGANLSFKWFTQYTNIKSDHLDIGMSHFFSPELELFWNPAKVPGNKIFLRARYMQQNGINDSFFQIQVGYNLAISELINKKIDKK